MTKRVVAKGPKEAYPGQLAYKQAELEFQRKVALEKELQLQRLNDTTQVLESEKAVGLFERIYFALEEGNPTQWLPYVLVVILAIQNLLQIEGLSEQINFLVQMQQVYGDAASPTIEAVLESDEFAAGVSDVVGQTLTEIFAGPVVLLACQLVLNFLVAQVFGRNVVPYVIVGEAAIEAYSQLAGNNLGSWFGEKLQPYLADYLSKFKL
jgi:hypothetical protein